MNDVNEQVFTLLDEYAGGPTPVPPSHDVIAAGRRRRRFRQSGIAATALATAAVIAVGSVVVADNTGSGHQHIAVGRPLTQPTAAQLAAGHWKQIPKAPIALCDPLAVSDGTGVIVIEYGFRPCHRAAARYSPATNSWSRLATPPADLGEPPTIAWGGGRLVSIAPDNTTLVWTAATNRWTKVQSPPGAGARSIQALTWTGTEFVALRIDNGDLYAYRLDRSGKWSAMTAHPYAPSGQAILAAATSLNGTLYAVLAIEDDAGAQGKLPTVHSQLMRYTGDGWYVLALDESKLPLSQLSLAAADGQVIASGSMCTATSTCTLEDAVSAVIRFPNQVRRIHPPQIAVMPYPRDVTAGGHAVYASYADGTGNLPSPKGPVLPTGQIYDLSTRKWLKAPQNSSVQGSSATWTSGGVVLISPTHDGGNGQSTSWLLAPKTVATAKPSTSKTVAASGLGSLICRPLPDAYAAGHVTPTETRLTSPVRLPSFKVVLSPAPAGYQPKVSAATVFANSGINREPGVRFSIFLARVRSTHKDPAKYTPDLHGQVLWVIRTFKTSTPFAGLPPPITAADRECAGLKPPVSIISPVTGQSLITGS